MFYFFITIGLIWVISDYNDKRDIDNELIKDHNEKWVNDLIKNL